MADWRSIGWLVVVAGLGACEAEPPLPSRAGLPEDGTFDGAVVETVLDDLERPRDLAFNPQQQLELWIVEQRTESMVVVRDADRPDATAIRFDDESSGPHFLARPSALAFGVAGAMATIHDTDEKTQGEDGTPPDFMGPTLWSTFPSDFDGGHGGHLDMLHNSPLGMGVAWEEGNAYWVFDGYHGSLTRYDFQEDHGLGGSDHTDGIIARYVEGEVRRADDGTPSHLWYHHPTDELLAVDGGNGRVIVLDALSGTRGANLSPNYDGADQYRVESATYEVLLDGGDDLVLPSGIAVRGDVLYVSDAGDRAVRSYTLDGEPIAVLRLDHDINGIAFDRFGRLFFVDPEAGVLVRITGG